MSQQELPIDSIKTGSGNRGSSSRTRTSSELLLEQQTRRHIPLFEPIDAEDARARAAVEQWRTFSMLLEPQPGSTEAANVCEQLIKLATGAQEQDISDNKKTHFTVVTKELLVETAKQHGISGKRALAQALVWIMRTDQEEGLAAKKIGVAQSKEEDFRYDEDGNIFNEAEEPDVDEREQHFDGVQDANEPMPVGEGEDEEQDLEAIALQRAEREKAKLELRAARLFTTVDDELGAPDRVYILKGFPVTDVDAAQFLEENDAFYTSTSAKKRKSSAQQPPKPGESDERPAFLSALDAVVQLTTRDLTSRPAEGSQQSERGTKSRPGTASSDCRTETASSTGSTQGSPPRDGGGREVDDKHSPRMREGSREKPRTPINPFTQASGVTKALAVAQTKGGTVWQDLSFCYINVTAREDPLATEKDVRSPIISPRRKSDRAPAKGKEKPKGETRNILDLAGEFNKMVTQMAFEKFDFHQWFSTAQVVSIPRRDKGIDLVQAVVEAQAAVMGPPVASVGSSAGCQSGARVDCGLWATDPTLAAYADLMSAVPDELCSVATALYGMVEAVMLECTGAAPRSLSTSPPAPLGLAYGSRAPVPPSSIAIEHNATTPPLKNGCLDPSTLMETDAASAISSTDNPTPAPESGCSGRTDGLTEGTDPITLSATRELATPPPPPPPLPRNLVLEFGDFVGKRAACGALNRAAAFGESRVDPRAVVAVERAAIEKLQNPRLVGQGALPREPEQNQKDRGTEQGELMTFTDLGKKDVERTRQVWALERLLNGRHPPPGQGEVWNFVGRRYWDVLPQHVVQQVLQADNGMEPSCLRQYYPPTDELLVALFHTCPPGRARICSWDPCTSGSIPFNYRPSFKDWADMAVAKGSSYTPRTLCALGALMDVSKADLDRAKTKSVKLFPADNSLVVMSGFVATGERWLSTFKDGHVMGLRLTEPKKSPSRGGTPDAASRRGTSDSHGVDAKITRIEQFAARFTMAFDDDSRIVVQEGEPAPPPTPPLSASSGGKKGKPQVQKKPVGKKPDGFGTVSCVQTFPTGLVVTTGSDGTVGMKFVPNTKGCAGGSGGGSGGSGGGGGGGGGKASPGSVPEASREELTRAVVGRGTVVRHMRDGSVQMLFVTGDVVVCTKDETILTDKCGRAFRKVQKPPSSNEVKPLTASTKTATPATPGAASAPSALEPHSKEWLPIPPPTTATASVRGKTGSDRTVKNSGFKKTNDLGASNISTDGKPVRDVETGALVWCSPSGNGPTMVIYEDGLTVTRHADGTVQRWQRGWSDEGDHLGLGLVLVECAGFPSVEVDIEIEEMCSRHARGEPVTITRGGNRVRLRAAMPNGGATLVTYDTRVTSQVCGRVICVHSDNTEVIASDKGEVVVRPRGLWEGRPVHDVIAGPNSSMPPNCAQPELLVGAYTFDCLKGTMETEDTDRNRFVLDVTKTEFLKEGFSISRVGGSTASGAGGAGGFMVPKEKGAAGKRSSSRPSSGKSDGVSIDLAGENTSVRADAVINNPLEPRLFVYRRDGTALELLRADDARKWCESLSLELPPPLQHQQQRHRPAVEGKDVGRRQVSGRALTASVVEEGCCAGPHSRGARQLSFFVPLQPILRGEGSFAAFLERRSGHIFGDSYHSKDGRAASASSWRTRTLPLAAKAHLGGGIGSTACGFTIAMEACIRRVWLEHVSLSSEAEEELRRSLARWGAWKQARAEQIDRFAVSDPRPASEVEAQLSIQSRLRKAFREAKAARQKKREKARAARAKAAADQAAKIAMGMDGIPPGAHAGLLAVTSNATLEESSTVDGGTWGGGDGQEDDGDEDEDDVGYPDSENEEEDEETLDLRQEATSAYASAGGETRGHLDFAALRLAMVTVLGRAVRESEAESRLLAVRKRTFPRQPKASVSDLFDILLAARRAASEAETDAHAAPNLLVNAPTTTPDQWTGQTPEASSNLRCPMEEGRSADLAPPAFITSSLAKAGNGKKKPPSTPTDFWNTPVGRSLGASAVGWATTSSGGGEVSRQRETFNHFEGEREDAGEEGRDAGHPILGGSSVDCIGSGAPPTRRENGQSCDEGASTKSSSERVVVPTSTVTQENPRSDKTNDTPAAHTTSSDETCDPPAEHTPSSTGLTAPVETGTVSLQDPTESARRESDPTPVEYDALAEERRQNTRPMKVCGADRDKEARTAKGGKCPPAQGTGTKAVRSLSQVAGGRALAEAEGEESSLLFESATGSTRRSFGRSLVFEVTPTSVSLGRIEVGRRYTAKIQVANVADKPARFRISSYHNLEDNGQERSVTVAGYARGKVAAGIAVTVNIAVLARRQGPLLELLPVVAEDGTTEVTIRAEAFEAGEGPAIAALP